MRQAYTNFIKFFKIKKITDLKGCHLGMFNVKIIKIYK